MSRLSAIMDYYRDKLPEDFIYLALRVERVIDSCRTADQLHTACRYVYLAHPRLRKFTNKDMFVRAIWPGAWSLLMQTLVLKQDIILYGHLGE